MIPAATNLGNCKRDCQCSRFVTTLGIDSSHLFFLARAAALEGQGGVTDKLLIDIVRAHNCEGERNLVMSGTCADVECFRKRDQNDSSEKAFLSDFCPDPHLDTLRSLFEVRPDQEPSSLPNALTIEGRHISFDAGERSLLQILLADENDAVLVTNDEDAFDVIQELMITGKVSVMPMTSLSLIRDMYTCGALSQACARLMCQQVGNDLIRLTDMSQKKQTRKRSSLEDLINYIELSEASAVAPAPGGQD